MSSALLPEGPYYACEEHRPDAPNRLRLPGDLRLIGGTWMCEPCWRDAGYFRDSDGWSWEQDFPTLATVLSQKEDDHDS